MDFSFIIASNRTVENYVLRVVDSINRGASNNFSHEILVVHPQENIPDRPNTKYIIDRECVGPLPAFNHIAKMTTGDVIISFSDAVEVLCDFNYWASIMNSDEMKSRKLKLGGTGHDTTSTNHPRTGLNKIADIIRWPFVSRETFVDHMQEYFFHPSFLYHCGDCWLGAWCHLMGEPAREWAPPNCLSDIHHEYNSTHDDHDMNTLVKLCYNFPKDNKYSAVI